MATRLKRSTEAGQHEWLIGLGIDVATVVHDGGFVEIQMYDHEAPAKRRWTITVVNRNTQAHCTLTGELQQQTRDEAFRQIGATPPYEKLAAA